MKKRDLKVGDCFRYTDNNLHGPKVLSTEKLKGLPEGWRRSLPRNLPNANVVLLEHYSTHPIPTPKASLECTCQVVTHSSWTGDVYRELRRDSYCQIHGHEVIRAIHGHVKEIGLVTAMTNRQHMMDTDGIKIARYSTEEREAWAAALREKIKTSEERERREREVRVDRMFEDWE